MTFNFNDIFKSSFTESITSFSATDTLVALGLALAIGLFILLIYKKTFQGVLYSAGFGLSLVAITLVTTLIILAISSNVILSLGMVGALSIVRFRTAVKEPLDIAFLFWAISTGIVLGAGLIPLALVGCAFIGVILLIFAKKKVSDSPYILIVNMETNETEQTVNELLKANLKKHCVKSKKVSASGIEATWEVRMNNDATQFINQISAASGVKDAILVSINSEYLM